MPRLIETELMKLRRSYMVLIGAAGAAVVPLLAFLMLISTQDRRGTADTLEDFFRQTSLFGMLLVGLMLFGLLLSYLVNREFQEGTVKSLLVIPVSRGAFLTAKLAVGLLWVVAMMLLMVALVLLLGAAAGFQGYTLAVVFANLKIYLAGGAMMFLLATPVVFLGLATRSYVVGIAFTVIATIGNVFAVQSKYADLYPWTAAMVLVSPILDGPEHSDLTAGVVVALTAAVSLAASYLLLARQDIH